MSVRLIFKGDLPAYDVDRAIFSDSQANLIDVSDTSPDLNYHNITVGKSGNQVWVEIGGVGKSELSKETIDSVISTVPTDHIRTEDA